jgi:hypothetical protein
MGAAKAIKSELDVLFFWAYNHLDLKRRFFLKKAIAVLFILSILTSPALASEYPVRWTSEVELKDLKEIDALLNKPAIADFGKDDSLTMELGGNQIEASNISCNEYFYLKYQGYEPLSNADQGAEGSSLKIPCHTLQYLKKAQPSKISYLHDFKLSADPLKNLPLTLGHHLSSNEEVASARAKGLSWKEFEPNAEVEVKNPNNISIVIQDSEGEFAGTDISLLAWGDFNGDGIEDILLSVTHFSGASGHDFSIAAITKTSKDRRITQLMTLELKKVWEED